MKKIFIMISLFAAVVFTSVTAYAVEGDGTKETPFLITDQDELLLVSDFPDCYFRLENDIELTRTWTPICNSSNEFTGELDGNGYAILNINFTNTRNNGFFIVNNGTVKNLKFYIQNSGLKISFYDKYGYTYNYGIIAASNKGTISDCSVEGNINVTNDYNVGLIYTGGVCGQNSGVIRNISSNVYIKTSGFATDYVGGIAGNNGDAAEITGISSKCILLCKSYRGGIAGENSGKISNSYCISSECPISGGIVYSGKGMIENSYSVITASANSNIRGIICDVKNTPTVKNCFYDQTVSNAVNNGYGVPKSTIAMKMKRTFTSAGWDFENVWGIDSDINNGYPYLLWEYKSEKNQPRYTLNSIKLKNSTGVAITEIPENNFYVEVNVTKNDNYADEDALIIAIYDDKGNLMDMKYMSGVYYQNQTVNFGTMINNQDNKVGKIKSFIWNSVNGMMPLSNAI